MYVELEDLQEGRSYAIEYGGRDKEHTFDGSVFDRFVENADTRRHVARFLSSRLIAQRPSLRPSKDSGHQSRLLH